mmetsp:Transcript_114702/g.222782  ORF Transcript_114702/g.222782 Transcript_114702/m.222782 type:complete len:110 (+) Transcript_114702:1364-1693(+)
MLVASLCNLAAARLAAHTIATQDAVAQGFSAPPSYLPIYMPADVFAVAAVAVAVAAAAAAAAALLLVVLAFLSSPADWSLMPCFSMDGGGSARFTLASLALAATWSALL